MAPPVAGMSKRQSHKFTKNAKITTKTVTDTTCEKIANTDRWMHHTHERNTQKEKQYNDIKNKKIFQSVFLCVENGKKNNLNEIQFIFFLYFFGRVFHTSFVLTLRSVKILVGLTILEASKTLSARVWFLFSRKSNAFN